MSRQESVSAKENDSLKVLRNQLSVLKRGILQSDENIEGKIDIMKEFIRTFIVNSLEAGVAYTDISEQLEILCYHDMVVYDVLVEWTFDELKRLYDINKHDEEPTSLPEAKSHPISPRKYFSRKYVTNCLLLCKTVMSCHRGNYINFLSNYSHEFDEVSFSHSTDDEGKLNPYMIAKIESTNEIYIAFCGEPRFDVWQETGYSTFSEGISLQLSRIPIRFFIEQIRNNYSIIFTGFSMGGLLALSVYASLWKDTCLSINDLLENVVCITFGTPLVPLEELELTLKAVPNMKENNHLVIMEDDIIPRLMQFSEVRSSKKGQFPKVGELVFNKLASYAKQKIDLGPDSVIDLADLKVILQDKNLAMTIDTKIFGKCHYMYTDMSNVSISLLASGAVTERLKVPDVAELDLMTKLGRDIMKQHTLSMYENNLVKAKFIQAPSETRTSPQLKEVKVLNPEVSSVTFYRHGDEIALVLQGENLWFCSKISIKSKSGSRVIDTMGADATSRSIHFNYVPKNENDLLIEKDAETVDIVYYSCFAKPKKRKLPVSFKGEYHVSFRQRQVAMLTPDQVIVISFLCALLEVNTGPRCHSASSRYKAIRKFLDEAVRIVPLESIFYAIAFGPDENAWKCASAFLSTDLSIPPSYDLSQALGLACSRLILGMNITSDFLQNLQRQAIFQHWTNSTGTGVLLEAAVGVAVHSGDDNVTVSAGPVVKSSDQIAPFQRLTSLSKFHQQSENSKNIIQKFQKLKQTVDSLCNEQIKSKKRVRYICGLNIEKIYSEGSQSNKLLYPISVLKNGRKELQDFQKEAEEELFQLFTEGEDTHKKKFNNEKMISTLYRIFTNDLFLCAYVLGAFMQQQIKVPFVDSTIDTARILQSTESPPAVGVWALFCLNMIDFQKMARAKKGALVVKVEKYIKGIFAKGSDKWQELFPEQLYAGKLQFLTQCLVSYVSCNSNYISYSFESQLAHLCEERNIRPATRVQDMIKDWNKIFKDDLLFYIMEEFRPIVARWILWCLSVHHLREELASHTTVGIIGLSNSGKSCLVKNLFKQKVISGTTTMERTTVPFLYNLEGLVDGLDVIDFPGMDDKDENVVEISHILLQISQLVIVVVDYRRCNTKPVSQWIEVLKNSGVPVLICLTHADKLFAATCLNEDGELECSLDDARRIISQELEKLREVLQHHPSWKVDLFSFALDSDSKLNNDILSNVGISFSFDVGLWIETELRDHMEQPKIAERLQAFLSKELKLKNKVSKGSPPDIRGLDIIAETSLMVTHEGHEFIWEGQGLQITFPHGAVAKRNRFFVKVISSGHYKLPDDTELVSSLYWLYFPEKFLKPVDVQIQHCCPPSLCEQKGVLNFIKGRCDQELPYSFKIRSDASFSCYNQKGLLTLSSFCILGIIRSFRPQPTAPDPPPQIHPSLGSTLCVLKVYSKWEGKGKFLFDFVFMKDLESFHSAVEKKYQESGWYIYVEELFEFESVSLSLNIAQDADLKDWNCLKRNPGKIKRSLVNCCRPESCPNHCLQFEWSKEEPPINMSCPIKIFMGVHAEPIELTLSLPLGGHSHSEKAAKATHQQLHELHEYDSSLSACNAMRALRDSGFSFTKSSQWLMTELGIDTEHKRTLLAGSSSDYCMPLEEAIDWWITNKDNSWSLLVKAVSKIEEKTSQKMKTAIPNL